MKKLLISIFVFFSFIALDGEVLFFKTTNEPITPKEHGQLYQIMLLNQFPANINFAPHMTTLIKDEIVSIQSSINMSMPKKNIKAHFIPTSLYQLFCLHFISENFDTISEASFGVLTRQKSTSLYKRIFDTAQRRGLTSSIEIYHPEYFDHHLLNSSAIAFHAAINNHILKAIFERGFAIPNDEETCIKLLHSIDFEKSFNVLQNKDDYYVKPQDFYVPHYFEQAIAIEWLAQKTHSFVLYRGSAKNEWKKETNGFIYPKCSRDNYSHSFGTSLLGGALFDLGACAYFYIWNRQYKTAILIDQKEYARGSINNMFFIAPTIGLLDLLGRGSLFHSRSRVPDLADLQHSSMSAGYKDGKYLTHEYQITAKNQSEAHQIYKNMLTYIAQNHIAITASKAPK